MKRSLVGLVTLAALAAITACSSSTPTALADDNTGIICTAVAIPGIKVGVIDSITTQALASGALVIAREGTYADTARGDGFGGAHFLAYERPGVYSVTVERAGYKPWKRDGVTVAKGVCHVSTTEVTAKLQK